MSINNLSVPRSSHRIFTNDTEKKSTNKVHDVMKTLVVATILHEALREGLKINF